ncbi:MAG TPA: glycosyltransferase family 2 protein, partial [Nitrospirales bacterium]|nr:glycosyltransferase family 2 protein [Nitrospirales bacterium]
MTDTIFWLALALVLYTYLGYPALVLVLAWARPRPVGKRAGQGPRVSIVIAVHNEASRIAGRIGNCLGVDYPVERLEVIVVSDGSTDGTDAVLAKESGQYPEGRVRWASLPDRLGKAAALNRGVTMATGDIVLFTDARQRFHPGAIRELVENFNDPIVGAVSGELILVEATAGMRRHATGLYWRYEKAIRKAEADLDSAVGATGAIYAIRRMLYEPLPAGTLLDDVLVPMRVVLRGYRVAFEERAFAHDVASPTLDAEFSRKVRTLAGNYQILQLEPCLLSPRWNPIWWQYISHKVLRLLVPYALIALFVTSAMLAPAEPAF